MAAGTVQGTIDVRITWDMVVRKLVDPIASEENLLLGKRRRQRRIIRSQSSTRRFK